MVLALERYLSSMTKPLAVRSSSLFEDAFLRPFAGVYDTYMLPNTATKVSTRLDELCWAIKMVYASTYKQEARRYSDATGNRAEEEKMAVILQELVGNDHQGYFYPALAGVANSIDYYPAEGADPSHGCVQIALGLGNTVVDGVPAVQHINLGKPNKPAGPSESMMPVSALDLHARAGYDATPADAFVTLPASAAPFLTFPRVAKVEIAPEAAGARALPGLTSDVHGEKVVFHKGYGEAAAAFDDKAVSGVVAQARRLSLKELLASEVPLAQALSFLLRLGTIGLGCPVEVEFALKLRNSPTAKHELHVLQIRPQSEITASASARALRFNYLPSELNAVVASTRALGHGSFEGIRDVVYVSPDRCGASPPNTYSRLADSVSPTRIQLLPPSLCPHPPPDPILEAYALEEGCLRDDASSLAPPRLVQVQRFQDARGCAADRGAQRPAQSRGAQVPADGPRAVGLGRRQPRHPGRLALH